MSKTICICFVLLATALCASAFKLAKTLTDDDGEIELDKTHVPEKYMFCDKRCSGSCYFGVISQSIPFQWTGANGECGSLAEGGHLANVYNPQCFDAVREYLVSGKSHGEFLVGMTYENAGQFATSDDVKLYGTGKTITNPRWYRSRPNRIGQKEMVFIVGNSSRYSGLRNILDARKHMQILCEVPKK